VRLITAPIVKPVTLADVEAQVRATLTSESALINAYISAVTDKAENYTRRALITQTWEITLDRFPLCRGIALPLSPVQSITSIKYIDTNGVEQTVDPTAYVLTAGDPAEVYPVYGLYWPSTRTQPDAVTIRYVCGYGGPAVFAAGTTYALGDRVLYTNGNTYQLTTLAVAGTLPTDATKWTLDHPGFAVPDAIRIWMMMNIASLHENRESVGKSGTVEFSSLADSLLDSYRLVQF